MPGPVNLITRAAVDRCWRRLGAALCRPSCLACGEPAPAGADLCAACARDLPWNATACPRCAVPLPGLSGDPGLSDSETRLAATAVPGVPVPGSAPAPGLPAAMESLGGWQAPGLPSALPAPVAAPVPPCGNCLRRPPPLQAAHAALRYAAPVDRLLTRFKFHRDLAAGRLLAEAMAARFAGLPRPDALLPVPLHRDRLRRRGYDQALELARPLARALDLPLLAGALRRVLATRPQSELDAAARSRNLRGAFAAADGAALPRHVVLVDDVMTTGATLYAAATALRRAGVERVDAWVCARVP